MIRLHEFGIKHYILIGLLVIFLLMRILNKKQWVSKYKDFIFIFIFAILAILVGLEFWKEKIYIGLLMLVLASAAVGKIFYDKL